MTFQGAPPRVLVINPGVRVLTPPPLHFSPLLLSGLIGWWRMAEPSGSVSLDSSPEGNNGAYTAVTLAQPGIGDGHTAASYDGATSFDNIYSAALNTDFNKAEGTLGIWAKVSAAGVWTDATVRRMVSLTADGNNLVRILRTATNNQIDIRYTANNVTKTRATTVLAGTTNWFHVALTWSVAADQVKHYVNGAQDGATLTGLGVWAGALASGSCCIGAATTVPANVWSGLLANCVLYNRALAATEVAQLAKAGAYL